MATLIAAVPGLISMEEYLASTYEPDMEYVDGALEEKNLGGPDHGYLQIAIGAWFFNSY